MFKVSWLSFRVYLSVAQLLLLFELRGYGVRMFEEGLRDAPQSVQSSCRFKGSTRIFVSQVASNRVCRGLCNAPMGCRNSYGRGAVNIEEPFLQGGPKPLCKP